MGNDEIGHITEADDAGVCEAPNARNGTQGASGGYVDDHDVCASRIDPVCTVCVGDDSSSKRDVTDRVQSRSIRLGERHGDAAA